MINRLVLIAFIFSLQSCGGESSKPKLQSKVLIGILDIRLQPGAEGFRDRLVTRLQKDGVVTPNRAVNFVIEYPPYAMGIAGAAERLVANSPDILIATNDTAAIALGAATKKIPIVFQSYDDPVATGIVQSLTAPSANLTGFNFYRRTHLKRWELLKEVAPRTKRIGILLDPNFVPRGILEDMGKAKFSLHVEVIPLYLEKNEPISTLAIRLARANVDALDMPHTGHFTMNQKQTVGEIIKLNRPTSFDGDLYCSWGGTVCFARQNTPPENLASRYIKLILGGAHPFEIPVSSPAKYDMSINMTSIKALGLTAPQSIMSVANVYE
jgi:putative tryptophan/tyrosine transport system substrate-binding protein